MFEIKGIIRLADGSPAAGLNASAVDRDLRSEQPLGQVTTAGDGSYRIEYNATAYAGAERGTADLVVKALAADDSLLAASPVLFNAPASAVIDLVIPVEALQPPSRFGAIGRALEPLLGSITLVEPEEDAKHKDVSFLTGETGFDRTLVARFILAHRLAQKDLPAEFWFVLLGGAFFQWIEGTTVTVQLAAVSHSFALLDGAAVQKSLARGFALNEISGSFEKRVPAWLEAFAAFVARSSVSSADDPMFLQSALDHAGVRGAAKRETVARLFLEQRGLTPEVIAALEKDHTVTKVQLADVETSFRLADLTGGGFNIVRAVMAQFGVRRPEDIPALAKQPEAEWVELVTAGQAVGELTPPGQPDAIAGQAPFPAAEVYGKALARQVQEAYVARAGFSTGTKMRSTHDPAPARLPAKTTTPPKGSRAARYLYSQRRPCSQ